LAGDLTGTAVHVFGPVPSRRLGRSLGVDLVPHKTCTLDCVYCQVGRTTRKTLERQCFLPVETVVAEIQAKLRAGPRPDHITLAGSGEPTLYSALGELIARIKAVCDVPVAVLTNGTLLGDAGVREDCASADVVLPSLDAGDEAMFQRINRPAEGITLETLVAGMAAFRDAYPGQIWLEVFLVDGVNDAPEHVGKIAALARRFRPNRIQLNTAVRPTAEPDVVCIPEDRLRTLCPLFTPPAEVIADYRRAPDPEAYRARAEDILEMIRRRPVTLDDIAAGIGVGRNEAAKLVGLLTTERRICAEARSGKTYFRAV